jgi:16S rRNA (guanine527-N7)-methyltransferase
LIDKQILIKGAESLGLKLSENQIFMFNIYLNELRLWSDKINLTSIRDEREIIINHFLDSLNIKKHVKADSKLLDIGTGAGFPGVPLAISDNTLDVVVTDSVGKKIFFIKNVIRAMKLKNIKAIKLRADDTSNELERGIYDYVVTRAVSDIENALNLSKDYVTYNGLIILMRGKNGIHEWNKLDRQITERYFLQIAENINVPFSTAVKTNLFVRKIN